MLHCCDNEAVFVPTDPAPSPRALPSWVTPALKCASALRQLDRQLDCLSRTVVYRVVTYAMQFHWKKTRNGLQLVLSQ